MGQGFFKREQTITVFILLNKKKCVACWKCLDVCINNVLGRINLPWHKHILLVNRSACIGCMKCVKICNTGAISKINIE